MSKQLASLKRHEDWQIEKDGNFFWMTHKDFAGYKIEVWQSKGKWIAEILTEQKIQDFDGYDWLPAQENPFSGSVEVVKAEVVRRGQYWASKA